MGSEAAWLGATGGIILVLMGRWWLAWRCLSRRGDAEIGPISVVIPLKGWDPGLPLLAQTLAESKGIPDVEVIVVIDREHPRRPLLTAIPNVRCVEKLPVKNFRDKNARLLSGVRAARHDTIACIDSDVRADIGYLYRRLRAHRGTISFSIPLYGYARGQAEAYLGAFTAHSNFTIYAAAFGMRPHATAVGPTMVFRGRIRLLEALTATAKELADDHALGNYYARRGESVFCSPEAVMVVKTNATWRSCLSQVVRWMMLPRSTFHLMGLREAIVLGATTTLSFLPSACLPLAVLAATLGRVATASSLLSSCLAMCCIEALGALLLQARAIRMRDLHMKALQSDPNTNARHGFGVAAPQSPTAVPWLHLMWVPLALCTLLPMAGGAMLRRRISWRGSNVPLHAPRHGPRGLPSPPKRGYTENPPPL